MSQERSIRNSVSKTVPENLHACPGGNELIEPGEKITSRHLTMMQAMKQAISDSRKIWEPLPISPVCCSPLFLSRSARCFFGSASRFFPLAPADLPVCLHRSADLAFREIDGVCPREKHEPFFREDPLSDRCPFCGDSDLHFSFSEHRPLCGGVSVDRPFGQPRGGPQPCF